jgi:hypothetical protein
MPRRWSATSGRQVAAFRNAKVAQWAAVIKSANIQLE